MRHKHAKGNRGQLKSIEIFSLLLELMPNDNCHGQSPHYLAARISDDFRYSCAPPEHMFGVWALSCQHRGPDIPTPSTCINVRLRYTPSHLSVGSPLRRGCSRIPRIPKSLHSAQTYVREGVKLARSRKRNHVICYPTIYNCISRQHAHANRRGIRRARDDFESKLL